MAEWIFYLSFTGEGGSRKGVFTFAAGARKLGTGCRVPGARN